MKNLYINTCNGSIIIKLFNNNKIIYEETVIGQKNASQFIMPTIKKVVDEEKLDGIIVVNGPGSFTGVRLGVTIAKTFAYVLNIPIRTITSLEEMAYSIHEEKEIVTIKENKGYFIGVFDDDNNVVGEYKYLSDSEYDIFSKKYKVITDVTIDYNKVILAAMKKEMLNPHSVKPIYVKKIQVEEIDT